MTAAELEKLLAEVTPGPWVADGNGILTTKRESYVALCIGMGTRRADEAVRNARLIAMAPTLARKVIAAQKLVDAVKHMVAQFQHPDQMADEALAAWEAAQ